MFHFLKALYEQFRAYFLVIFYVCYRLLPPFKKRSDADDLNYLLITIPGAGGFNAQFGMIVKKLTTKYPSLKVLPYKPRKAMTCEQEAHVLAEVITQEKAKFTHIILLGHSRGGLLANEALKLVLDSENMTLITLATPWHGAIMAQRIARLKRFTYGYNIVKFFSWLLGTPIESCTYSYEPFSDQQGRIYPIGARYDLIVGAGARQSPSEELISLIPTTHLGIPFHRETVEMVLDIIQYISSK